MKKIKIISHQTVLLNILCLILGSMFLYSCEKDETDNNGSSSEVSNLKKLINEGSLLIGVEKKNPDTYLYFETDTIKIPSSSIQSIAMDKEKWSTALKFADNTGFDIPTLGNSIHIDPAGIKLNPTGYAPLSALLSYSAPVQGRLKMRIKSKDKSVPDLSHVFDKYGYNHQIAIHGLYPDYSNTVYISLTDKGGKQRAMDSVVIKTLPISIAMPQIEVKKANTAKMEQGLTLVSYIGDHEYDTSRPFMMDAAGNVRWLLTLKTHPQLQYFGACSGLKRLRNGNFLAASIVNGTIFELDMLGTIIKTWDVGVKGYEFHRDIIEIPNGNFLLAVTKKNSLNANGKACVFDYMIEVNRETGDIVTEWDFKKSLDQKRDTYTDLYSETDWAHQNAIAYSEKDNTVIVSNRFQGLAKLDWSNQVKWILSPHKGWKTNGWGESLKPYLLNPVDALGNKIANKDILDGNVAGDSFDWGWGVHCPVIIPNDKLLVFDNGYYRHYQSDKQKMYSRAVEYKINEQGNTIQQTWEFGKELGKDGYSPIVSSVQYLQKTDHVLFGSGAIGFQGHGSHAQGGGRIIEVDYKTKEVVFEAIMQVPTFYVFHRVTRMELYPISKD